MASIAAPNSRSWHLHSAQRRVARFAAWASARDLWFCLPFVALVLGLALRPVLAHDGWPMNHEELSFKYRLSIYAAHARRLDLLPIWSESMALGLGAPAPILYHKLFYLVALPLYLLLGSVKASLLATLGVFSVLGLLGASALSRFLGAPARASIVAGAALLFCNYAYTDWVVRGALAEYSAMMLLPWVFRWLVGAIEGEAARRLARSGALIFPALYLAHSLLFFFSAPPVLAAVVWRLARGHERKAFLRALLVVAGAFALIATPILVCQLFVVRELEFAAGIAIFAPRDHFRSLTEYLTGGDFVWGREWDAYSVQLDLPLVVVASVTLVATLATRIGALAAPRGSPQAAPRPPPLGGYTACWLSVAYFACLQSPISEPLYALVPGFSALQFPWRLLAFLSVLSVTLAAVPLLQLARFAGRDAGSLFAWILLVVTYVSSPWMHEIRYQWLPTSQLEGAPPAEVVAGAFEYHPRVEGAPGPLLIAYTNQLQPSPGALRWTQGAYSVERLGERGFETGIRAYRVSAAQPSTVVLPIAYSPFIHVSRRTPGYRARLPTHREKTDPRIHVNVPAGVVELEIEFPTLLSFYGDLLVHGAAAAAESAGPGQL